MNFEDCSFFKVPSMKYRNLLYLYFRTWHPCHQNFRLKKPIVILTLFNDDNILTILIWSQESIMWQEIQKKCQIALLGNPIWPFLNKSSWETALSTANFWQYKTKVSVNEIKSILQHPLCPHASRALIRIDFHPEMAEK